MSRKNGGTNPTEKRGEWADKVISAVVGRDLPPTAQKILMAAQRVLARDGYDGLSLSRIAEEALETKSLVLYHFGRRANLEALLVDSLWHDIDAGFVRSVGKLPRDTNTRVDALIRFYAGIAENLRLWRMYYDLLPSVIGARDVRKNLARIYESYRRDINVRCLQDTELTSDEVKGLSSLFLAVGEALPLQTLMDRDQLDTHEAFLLFGDLAKNYARNGHTPEPQPSAPGEALAQSQWIAHRDPGQEQPKPAQKILRAARRLLEKKGLTSLTLDSIAAASKQPRSSVSYYFQGKQGLIDAVFDSVLYSHQRAYQSAFSGNAFPEAETLHHHLFGRTSPIRAFFLTLPVVLRDPDLHKKASVYYGQLRDWLAAWMTRRSLPPRRARILASVMIACVDGIAIQTQYDPDGFEPMAALETIHSLIAAGLHPTEFA